MTTTEILCKSAVFHFNKKHLEDSTIPPWCLKTKGKTYYVNHVECTLPWSTKETSTNPHTQGSIKIRDCVLTIDQHNCALLTAPTDEQRAQLSHTDIVIRVLFNHYYLDMFQSACDRHHIVSNRKVILEGDCGNLFCVAQLSSQQDLTVLILSMPAHTIRELMPNETYHRVMDMLEDSPQWQVIPED